MDQRQITRFQETVLVWYRQVGRKLPWRQTTDPYRIMVSELMLQQTQVDRVIPKYQAWLEKFPTVKSLAQAPVSEVIIAWSGLGYNRRALFLQKAAQAIVQLAEFPHTYEALIALPGIGPYTAAAICSFAYNQDIALVDTNIKRIYQLIIFGDQSEPTDKQVRQAAERFLPHGFSRDWHNALMDLGTVIAKGRGAKQQQELLVRLFPELAGMGLPEVSDQSLKRPKQSDFKTSARYWRGLIVAQLRQHNQLTTSELKNILTQQSQPLIYDYEQLLHGLVKDGLIYWQKDRLSLPGSDLSRTPEGSDILT